MSEERTSAAASRRHTGAANCDAGARACARRGTALSVPAGRLGRGQPTQRATKVAARFGREARLAMRAQAAVLDRALRFGASPARLLFELPIRLLLAESAAPVAVALERTTAPAAANADPLAATHSLVAALLTVRTDARLRLRRFTHACASGDSQSGGDCATLGAWRNDSYCFCFSPPSLPGARHRQGPTRATTPASAKWCRVLDGSPATPMSVSPDSSAAPARVRPRAAAPRMKSLPVSCARPATVGSRPVPSAVSPTLLVLIIRAASRTSPRMFV